ncbi:MAG: PPOX class F420-dependent oxidoreductase [Actinobacteria bacterium]|nr:PPOX class F420-dependent oxidoreductase [Actinomycetota bacterium]
MVKMTESQGRFLQEPNYAVVAALREDGSPHLTVIWIDWDGEHVLNLNTWRSKLRYMRGNPRVSVLVIDRESPYKWISIDGEVAEITTEGAYEHIVRQAGVYLGRDSYALKPGEERVLVRVRPLAVEAYGVDGG